MPVSLSALLTPLSAADALQLLTQLETLSGFPTSAWQSGTVGETFTEAESSIFATFSGVLSTIATSSSTQTATGPWLDQRAQNFYGATRQPAVVAQGPIVFQAAPGVGPVNIPTGTVLLSTAGLYYATTTPGTISTPGGSVQVNAAASQPGSSYNAAPGTISTIVTSIAGVACTNPDNGQGQGQWSTTAGADAQSDASLQAQCEGQWTALGVATAPSYQSLCLGASSEITRVVVTASAGLVSILLAGASGAVHTAAVTAANSAVQPITPTGMAVTVASATGVTPTIVLTFLCAAAQVGQTMATAASNLVRLCSSVPLGGTLYLAEIVQAVMDANASMRNVSSLSLTATGGSFDAQGNLVLSSTEALDPPVLTLTPATY